MGRLFLRVFLWFWIGSSCLVVVLALSLVAAQPNAFTTWRVIGRAAMAQLGADAANTYERDGAAKAQEAIQALSGEGRFDVWLYTIEGDLIAGPRSMSVPPDLLARARTADDEAGGAADERPIQARRVTSNSGRQYVMVWEGPRRLRGLLQPSPWKMGVRLGALLLTGGVICWVLTWQITSPIRALRGAARRLADGDLGVRVGDRKELRRGDELSELAGEFDRMAAHLQRLLSSQQQLLADISHELRSPLARLSLALDLAKRRLGDQPEHQRMEQEVQRLNALIEELLTLARLRGSTDQTASESIDLAEVVHDVAADARFEAEAAGRSVIVTSASAATVSGNRALLRSALENVVRNAVRHAPHGSAVTIELERPAGGAQAVIRVRDCGPGVPAAALDRLFDPFFRVDDARDRSSGGVGLGLAIARQAMLAHGGQARAENHPDGGLLVRLELPAAS